MAGCNLLKELVLGRKEGTITSLVCDISESFAWFGPSVALEEKKEGCMCVLVTEASASYVCA